jgi:4-hydroxy-3-methylbut-2-en-1-yl diphosphate synthase IspG/GcpE
MSKSLKIKPADAVAAAKKVITNIKEFQCKSCGRVFSSLTKKTEQIRVEFKAHVKTCRVAVDYPVKCVITGCGYSFKNKDGLEKHTSRVHKKTIHTSDRISKTKKKNPAITPATPAEGLLANPIPNTQYR